MRTWKFRHATAEGVVSSESDEAKKELRLETNLKALDSSPTFVFLFGLLLVYRLSFIHSVSPTFICLSRAVAREKVWSAASLSRQKPALRLR